MAKVKKATKPPRTKSGEEITPEIADALAAEAERGYDLSKAKRQRAGLLLLVPEHLRDSASARLPISIALRRSEPRRKVDRLAISRGRRSRATSSHRHRVDGKNQRWTPESSTSQSSCLRMTVNQKGYEAIRFR